VLGDKMEGGDEIPFGLILVSKSVQESYIKVSNSIKIIKRRL